MMGRKNLLFVVSVVLVAQLHINPTDCFLYPRPIAPRTIIQIVPVNANTRQNPTAKIAAEPSPPTTTITTTMKTTMATSTTLSLGLFNPIFAISTPSVSALTWVASTIIGGTLGTPFVTKATSTWYKTIPLPSYTPPNGIFAPTWSLLYTCMGIASWRIRSIAKSTSVAAAGATSASGLLQLLQQNVMLLSFIHYGLNIIWAPIFFGMKKLRVGHVLNVLILLSLLPIMFVYGTMDLTSSLLLVPYFVWLSFAVRLSSGICKLNPTVRDMNGSWYDNNAKLESGIWKLRNEAAKRVGL